MSNIKSADLKIDQEEECKSDWESSKEGSSKAKTTE